MMKKKNIGIQEFLIRHMVLISFILFGLLLSIWGINEYFVFSSKSNLLREEYQNSQKAMLRSEVNNVVSYIDYMKTQTEKRLKSELQGRVYEAIDIATNIYQENSTSKPLDEIKKMVKDALRPIRFLNGRGYYFAFSMDGIEALFADKPEMEGLNMLSIQSAEGEYVVKDMIDIISNQQEGYYQYSWTKPAHGEKSFPKITFVKYFKPFDWVIGTGEYLDDFTNHIQDTVLERIVSLRFSKEGYFFGSLDGGYPLFTNGKITKGIESKSIWNLTDPDGIKIIQEQQKISKNHGGGFVKYSWHKLGSPNPSPKVSFVREITDWGWIIGAGVYMDTIEKVILKNEEVLKKELGKKIKISICVFICLIVLICFWAKQVAGKTRKSIKSFESSFEKAIKEHVTIPADDMQFRELSRIAESANKMINAQKQSEIALLDSEERFRYLSDASMEALFFTKDGFCLEANHVAAEIFGYENKSELIGMFGTDIIAPESHDIVKSNMLTNRFEHYEAIGMRKDGTRFPISIRAKSMSYKDAGIVRITSITDITKIKQAQTALRESEQDLKESQRIAHVGSWRLNLATNQVVWSEELYKMYGFDPAFPPPPYTEHEKLFTPESWSKLQIALNNTKDTGIPYELELETLPEEGKHGWMWVHGEVVRDARGVTVGLRGAAQDITKRKQTDEALKASEKKYQSLFNNAQVALFRNRLSDGKVLEINERYAKMAGYSNVQDCVAEFNAADAWVDPNGRKKLLEILQENGFVSDYETQIIQRDGTTIWISFSATVFPEQGFVEGSIVEITERKQFEIEREKLQAQLLQAQKMESVGRLAGGVAHDFNNMLSIILGNAEILMEDIDPSNPLVTNLEEIHKAAERSANLTRQLLAFARKQTIDPKILNLNHVLDDMLKMLKRLIGEDIDLTWQPFKKLWSVKIDPSQIDQILANLCVNARDAIKGIGKVTIETDNVSFDEAYCKEHAGFNPGDYVMIAVSDNGSGMDKKTLENLFEPFFTTKNIGQGTGLGLATVYGVVKQNNGFINVYSEPGRGTIFKIYLPVHGDTSLLKQKNGLKKTPRTGSETILIVEDEKSILMMTKMMLERLGYKVLTASSPNEAISIVETSNINAIHLLMTDVVMPEMNGRDLSKKLVSMYPGLKCLFMSGYTANVIAHHGVLDTGVQFINKPFSTQDLASKVREVLDGGKCRGY